MGFEPGTFGSDLKSDNNGIIELNWIKKTNFKYEKNPRIPRKILYFYDIYIITWFEYANDIFNRLSQSTNFMKYIQIRDMQFFSALSNWDEFGAFKA